MGNRSCTACAYAWWNPGQWLASLPLGFPLRPVCANHPDAPGLMAPVPLGGPCRNYRAKPATPTGDVKQIPLGAGRYAYVDAADYEWLSRYRWSRCGSGYAGRREKGRLIFMHRQIMQPPRGMVVDHIDGNRANNCRANMRNCTDMQNRRNQAKRIGCVCQFKGVYYHKRAGKHYSSVMSNGKVIWLGYFDDEAEAARAYDRKVVELFGEFAWLNFPEDWPAKKRQQVHAQRQEAGGREGKKVGRKEGKTAAGRSRKVKGKNRKPRAETPGRRGRNPAAKPKGGPRQPAERQTAAKSLNSRKKRKNPKGRRRTAIKRGSKTRQSTRRKRQ